MTPPPQAKPDEFSPDSYWWLFRDLLDRIKGDEIGTAFNRRQPLVRAAFDRLEEKWAAEAWKVERQAVDLKQAGRSAEATRVLNAFTKKCLEEALETIETLRRALTV